MNLAIITCQRLPNGVPEDQPLFDALFQHKNINHSICIWDDKTVDWSQFDACLLRSVWDYHEKSAAFMEWVKKTSDETIIINPPEVIQWNSNKKYLKAMQLAGLPTAPTLWLEKNNTHDLQETLNLLPSSEQYFLKPTIGADSSGTFRFSKDQINQAQKHLELWVKQHNMMLQSYLPSVETYGEVSAIFFGGQFSHAIRKIPINGDYRVQDTFGATDQAHVLTKEEQLVALDVMQYIQTQFGLLSYARVDLLINKQGKAVVNELELIEPSLFFHHNHSAPSTLIKQIQNILS